MTFTREQKALLRPILTRIANFGGVPRLVDLLLAPDRDAQLVALVGAEYARVDARSRALPAGRAAEDQAIADSLLALDNLRQTLEAAAVAADPDPV